MSTETLPTGTIAGIVVDGSRVPITDATVTLYKDGRMYMLPENPQYSRKGTNRDGLFVFKHLSEGTYKVTAESGSAKGESGVILPAVGGGTATITVQIPGVTGNGKEVQYSPGVSGLVIDSNGNVVSGAQVSLYGGQSNAYLAKSPQTTGSGDAIGLFSFGKDTDTKPIAACYPVTAEITDASGMVHQGNATLVSGNPNYIVLPDYAYFAPMAPLTATPDANTTVATATQAGNSTPANSSGATVTPANTDMTSPNTTAAQQQNTPGNVFSAPGTVLAFIALAFLCVKTGKR